MCSILKRVGTSRLRTYIFMKIRRNVSMLSVIMISGVPCSKRVLISLLSWMILQMPTFPVFETCISTLIRLLGLYFRNLRCLKLGELRDLQRNERRMNLHALRQPQLERIKLLSVLVRPQFEKSCYALYVFWLLEKSRRSHLKIRLSLIICFVQMPLLYIALHVRRTF